MKSAQRKISIKQIRATGSMMHTIWYLNANDIDSVEDGSLANFAWSTDFRFNRICSS
jgi:hypothetical protein